MKSQVCSVSTTCPSVSITRMAATPYDCTFWETRSAVYLPEMDVPHVLLLDGPGGYRTVHVFAKSHVEEAQLVPHGDVGYLIGGHLQHVGQLPLTLSRLHRDDV